MCTVIVTNHRWCHNVLKTWLHLVSNFFVLTTFWCHLLLLNRHTDTWNLPFVKYTQFYCIMYIFLQPENIWTNKLSHPLGCCCLRFMSLQGLVFFSLNWQKAMLNCSVYLNLPVFSLLKENFSVEKTFFALKGFPWFEILSNVHNFTNGSFNCLYFHLLTDNMLVSASWLSTKLKQERKGWCTGMTCQVTT